MKRSFHWLAIVLLVFGGMVLAGTGCHKRVVAPIKQPPEPPPPPPPPPPPAAPTISLSASPATITSGQSATLKWDASNATSVTIDNGVGNVEASGSKTVSPTRATTYNAVARGPGGRSEATARVTVEEPPVTPPTPPKLSAEEFVAQRIQDIFFDFDKYDIRDDARQTLMSDAGALAERTEIRLTIEGHCDERGSEKYNLALGDRRANATKEFLVSQGVAANRLDTISYGEERPFVQGNTEEAYQKNRRAHFVLKP